jgi:hypothetical protein
MNTNTAVGFAAEQYEESANEYFIIFFHFLI